MPKPKSSSESRHRHRSRTARTFEPESPPESPPRERSHHPSSSSRSGGIVPRIIPRSRFVIRNPPGFHHRPEPKPGERREKPKMPPFPGMPMFKMDEDMRNPFVSGGRVRDRSEPGKDGIRRSESMEEISRDDDKELLRDCDSEPHKGSSSRHRNSYSHRQSVDMLRASHARSKLPRSRPIPIASREEEERQRRVNEEFRQRRLAQIEDRKRKEAAGYNSRSQRPNAYRPSRDPPKYVNNYSSSDDSLDNMRRNR